MRVEIFCLCESVQVSADKSIHISGVFDCRYGERDPVRLREFFVLLTMRFYKFDLGTYPFRFVMSNEAGKLLAGSDHNVVIEELETESQLYLMKFRMPSTTFRFGAYNFALQNGPNTFASVPLYVKPLSDQDKETNRCLQYDPMSSQPRLDPGRGRLSG